MSKVSFSVLFFVGSALCHSGYSAEYTTTTLAGSATYGSTDGTGSAARFYHPQGVAVDHSGNIYVADTDNSTIRKITSAGVVTTIAGSAGNAGFVDGVGPDARFWLPQGVAVDAAGNVYVSDTPNQVIKKIALNGTVTTLAGNVLFAPDWADGAGGAARFSNPEGIAVDNAGNVYVADYGNNAIRKITPSGQVTTLAGLAGSSGSEDGVGSAARFYFPYAVAVDGAGTNIYVADYGNNSIRKITASGAVTTLVANLSNPRGVTLDAAGNVYVADTGNHVIRKISPTGVVTTVAGKVGTAGSVNGADGAARFDQPYSVAVNAAGDVYVTSFKDDAIRKITTGGVVTTFAGKLAFGNNDGIGSAAQFYSPSGVAVDPLGNTYIADTSNHVIRKITAQGVVSTFAGTALASGSGDGIGSAARFNLPFGVALDRSGNVYVADTGNNKIRKITAAGVVSTLPLPVLDGPTSVAVDGLGNIYIATYGTRTIDKVTPEGAFSVFAGIPGVAGSVDGPGSTAQFFTPLGVVVDGSGNVYVSDYFNCTIRKISPAGVVSTFAGAVNGGGAADGIGSAAGFYLPRGVAVDGAGNVYVADSHGYTIRKITPAGLVSTIAGAAYLSGAVDGIGNAARFSLPQGVAVDGSGNVYVADTDNNTIRKVSRPVALTMSTQPVSQRVNPGDSVTLTVTVTGSPAPSYQWRKNGQNIPGATSNSYHIASSTAGQTGDYTVVAFNDDGLVTSGTATLRFAASVTLGGLSATYDTSPHAATAATTPAGLTVRFTYGGSSTLPTAAGSYAVVGTVDDGNYSGSSSGTLVIGKATPVITWAAPVAIIYGTGLSATQLSAQANTGGSFEYNPAFGAILDPGTRTLDVTFTPTDNQNYNGATGSVPLSVQSVPAFTTELANQSFAVGYGVTFKAMASGFPAPNYQWQKDGINIPGAISSSYSIASLVNGDAGSYRVIASNAAGSVASQASILTVLSPPAIASASTSDFNADGQSDLIWQNTVTGERSFWTMNGTTLKQGASLGTFAPDWTIAGSGDFNHDGKTDLLWQNTITGERSIWLMNGTSLVLGVDLGTYSTDIMIAGSGDFNGDGNTDIVWQNISTGERGIWLMNGTTKISGGSLGTVPTAWSIAGTGDFNSDGKMDLVWQNAATGERSVWLMNGTTMSSEVSLGFVAKQFQIVGTGDYNGDGKTDLVGTDTETGDRSVWLMNGLVRTSTVVFTHVSVEWSLGRPIFLTAQTAHADFNADGQTDIVWQNSSTGARKLWLMNGTTKSSESSLPTVTTNWVVSGTGDFNHDDQPDIVWTNTATGERSVWLMDGATFISSVPLTTVPTAWEISAIGDFNYDGKPDLVWTNTVTGERAIWLMNGTVFGSGISLGTIPTSWKIATTADLNGDGKTDLVWQNTSTGECSVWLMNGGAFTAGVALDTLPVQWAIVGSGDFNGDGKADLLLQNTATGERAIRLMNRTAFLSTVSLGIFDSHWSVGN